MRCFFNLTNGEEVIRDEEGLEVSNIETAVGYALEVIQELRVEAGSDLQEWQGWRLEIVDSTGRIVESLPLDASGLH